MVPLRFGIMGQSRIVSHMDIAARWMSSNNFSRSKKLRKQDFDYCVDLVQNRDRESYLCGLLMPHQSRRSYFAIRALNVELASIKDGSVSRQEGGAQFDESGPSSALRIRVKWWRDAIGQVYGDDTSSAVGDPSNDSFLASMTNSYWNNPVVRVLDYAVRENNLTRRFLERLFESREEDLDVNQLETMEEVMVYAERTYSSLLYLSLETTNVREAESDLVAYHAGIGLGIVTALRGVRIRLARGELTIPKELIPVHFPYHKLNAENPKSEMEELEHQQLREAVREMAFLALSHLTEARERQSIVPRHARPCLLPVVPAIHFLSKLEKAEYDIFDDSLLEPDQIRVLLLMGRTWLTGVF